MIDLTFDAADDFHRYAVEWEPHENEVVRGRPPDSLKSFLGAYADSEPADGGVLQHLAAKIERVGWGAQAVSSCRTVRHKTHYGVEMVRHPSLLLSRQHQFQLRRGQMLQMITLKQGVIMLLL